jgi:hypothetical protein
VPLHCAKVRIAEKESTPWNRFSAFDSITTSLGWSVLLLLYVLSLWSVTRPRIRPWFGIVTAVAVEVAILSFAVAGGRSA